MKEFKLKFGLQYFSNTWHVTKRFKYEKEYLQLISICRHRIHMGYANDNFNHYIYPIDNYIKSTYTVDSQLTYRNLCKECKKKHHLTEEDINHYIIRGKLGIK